MVSGIVLIVALWAGLVHLPYLQVQEIRVVGSDTEEDAQDIQMKINGLLSGRYGFLIPKRFILGLNTRALEQNLLTALPRFEKIVVAKQFPHTLSVSYTPRVFFALLCHDVVETETIACGYLDRTGFIYEDAPEAFGSLILKIHSDFPAVKVGTRAIDERTVQQMALLGESIQGIAGLRLLGFELMLQAPDELRVRVAPPAGGGFMLIVRKDDNPEAVLHILRTVLHEEIKDRKSKLDYVDLRFGNKVFYKFKRGAVKQK